MYKGVGFLCVHVLYYTVFTGPDNVAAQDVILLPSTDHVSENDSVTLTCSYNLTNVNFCGWSLQIQSTTINYYINTTCTDIGIPKVNTTIYSFGCTDGFTWKINRVTKQNDGEQWKCSIYTTSWISESNTVQINVEIPIKSLTLTKPMGTVVDIIENDNQEFVCVTSGGFPKPVVWWYKDQNTLDNTSDDINITSLSTPVQSNPDGLTMVTSTLTYTAKKNDTKMTIFCTANNTDTVMKSGRMLLNVKFLSSGPSIQEGNEYKVIDSRQGVLTCYDIDGNPRPTLKWFCNRGLETDYGTNGQRVGQRVTWTASRNDSGSCICQSSQIGLTPSARNTSIIVDVHYKTDITSFYVEGHIGQSVIEVSETQEIPFVCNVDSNPGATVIIKFEGKPLQSKDNTNTLSYLHINVGCLDGGVYKCFGSNRYNSGAPSLKELTVFILCSPRPLLPVRGNVTSPLRVSATLSFSTLAYPVPSKSQIIWRKYVGTEWETLGNNSATVISIFGYMTNLTITNVTEEDYGRYQLSVTNRVGTYVQKFSLIPEGVPDVPSEFKVLECFIKATSITFEWKRGWNGGLEQVFVLRNKKLTEDTWTTVTVQDDTGVIINYTLKELSAGTEYEAKIFARNSIGDSKVFQNLTFKTEDPSCTEAKQSNAPEIVGGSLGAVIVILSVYAVTITILYIRGKQPSIPHKDRAYANAAFNSDATGNHSDNTDDTVNQYTSLDVRSRDDTTAYDVIQRR